MQTAQNGDSEGAPPARGPARGRGGNVLKLLLGVLLPLAVLGAGAKITLYLVETGPKAERGESAGRNARLVEVMVARKTAMPTVVHAMGTVQAALRIDLQPRVAGEVVETSPELVPGGLFAVNDTILRIDPTDYDLIVRQRECELARVQSRRQLELGSQSIARSEYELLGEAIGAEDRDLVLRVPQLQSVEAAVAAAEAALAKARLDLERTGVRAPFNAIVVDRDVNLGAQVAVNTRLATLAGTDTYWIELALPVDQLEWIQIPRTSAGGGSLVRVYNEAAWGDRVFRTGRVIRLAGDLEAEGRMARLFAAVEDPLSLAEANANAPPLLIGSFVRVEIEGRELDQVVAVERRHLRDGDRVWIMDARGALDIRPVEVSYRGPDRVLVTAGIADGERIVTTDLGAPVAGMPLRTSGAEEKQPEDGFGAAGALQAAGTDSR